MRRREWTMAAAALVACLCAPFGTADPAPDGEAALGAARRLMGRAHFCTLVTLAEDGQPQARVVDPFPPEDGLTVWIATRPNTRKVAQIRADPRVTLLYFDPTGPGYVTLLGEATLVSDPTEKAKRWKDEWAQFYRDTNRGDDYLLIRVTPRRLEIVSEADGLRNDPDTWRPTVIDLP